MRDQENAPLVSSNAARGSPWHTAAGLLLIAILFVLLTIVPTQAYEPSCGHRPRVAVKGPIREQYVALLVQSLERLNFTHRRVGNTVLVPVLPIFDGTKHFSNWREFVVNFEWKLASSVADGVTIEGRFFPPPTPLVQLLEAGDATPEPFPRRRNGRASYGPDPRFKDDCDLFRAAVIRVEDLPQPLPALERSAIPRDWMAGPPEGDPAHQAR